MARRYPIRSAVRSRSRILPAAALALALCTALPARGEQGILWMLGGHAGAVNEVAFSPDGSVMASAADDATVKLWSADGALLKALSTHPYQATALAFSPDGTRLDAGVYAGGDRWVGGTPIGGPGRVCTWQCTEGWGTGHVALSGVVSHHLGKVTGLAFSPGGTMLASSGAEGSNVVVSVGSGTVLARKASYQGSAGPSISWDVAFSSGGLLASGCEDGTLRVWDNSWSEVWDTDTAHGGYDVTCVAFSPDGSRMATAGTDDMVRIHETAAWTCLRTLTNHTGEVTALAFSPDGATLASAGRDRTILLWDAAGGTCQAVLAGHTDDVNALAFSPDGTRLVSGGADHAVRLWSVAEGQPIRNLCAHTGMVKAAAVSPDGTLYATAGNDASVRIGRLVDGTCVTVLPGHTGCVSAVAFAPDSRVVATGGGPLDPTVRMWRVDDGSVVRTIAATSNGVMALAFSGDGRLLASGGDADEKVIRIWHADSGVCARILGGHSGGVTALAFSPDGERIASGGRGADNTVKVWSVDDPTPLRVFSGHAGAVESVAFSPDGTQVASGSSGAGALRVHLIDDGTSRTFGPESECVFFAAFSPDGSTLASACRDTVKLWDVATGATCAVITQETTRAACFAYSPNGNLVVCGREDGVVVARENALGAFAQVPPVFTSLSVDPDGLRHLGVAVQPLVRYTLHTSTNLADWDSLGPAVSDSDVLTLVHSNAVDGAGRFYRADVPP